MKTIALLILLLITCAAVIYVRQHDVLPVKNIQIDGELQHVNIATVEQIILQYVQHGLLRVNVGSMQQALMALPWISRARVSRVWPDTLHIWLMEPQAVAVWVDSGIVSQEGQVFYLPPDATIPEHLPIFEGIEGQVPLMLKRYQQMQALLAPLDLHVKRMILTPRLAWEIILDNELRLYLGQQQMLERLRRFVKAYPQLVEQQVDILDYIDLRYPNGFALKHHPTLPK